MLVNVLRNRLFLAGLLFFVVAVVGSLLYSWNVRRTTAAEVSETRRAVEALKPAPLSATPEVDDVSPDAELLEEPGMLETVPTQITSESDMEAVNSDAGSTLPPDVMGSARSSSEEVQVSPQGFGPYPEIPADYPEHLMPFWIRNPDFEGVPEHAAGPFELMDRVLIKLWKQGHTTLTGATLSNENGKIYPHYVNTAYVRYEEFTTPDGVIHQFVNKIVGGPDIAPYLHEIGHGDTPAHIRLLDFDNEGIDPHTFLKEEK